MITHMENSKCGPFYGAANFLLQYIFNAQNIPVKIVDERPTIFMLDFPGKMSREVSLNIRHIFQETLRDLKFIDENIRAFD